MMSIVNDIIIAIAKQANGFTGHMYVANTQPKS